ncbi:MAG: beta-lactamase domain protein [Acidimicrobiaceae bacterium]|nr:beta-lactamase domain protein [Acidimicrobiaceae bacterium]
MPCPSFLIEHDRGLVLFDTGVSPRGLANPEEYFPHLAERFQLERRPDLGVDYQIRGLGLRLEDVKYVVPSHLHFDHAGGLYLFPGSTFIVGEGEIEHAYMNSSGPYFLLDDISPTRSFRWIEIGGDLDLFGDGSVSILFSPGHTPGSLALFVRLPDRNFILSGDSCHYPAEVQLGAARSPGADAPRATRSLQRLILLRDTWDAYFWIGHDMGQWQEWPHAPASI